ncbi:hypothetical protein BDR06DRAFT_976099 [Suillus hirtellus]|nr:hypothetical protein BDR06DRAFT_976099 [Suillus hirtellus]
MFLTGQPIEETETIYSKDDENFFEKAVVRALKSRDDEDESDTELLETDESSDDENDTPSDLPGCLLALKGIKDKMLSLTDDREPQKFVKDNTSKASNTPMTMVITQYIYPPHSNNHATTEREEASQPSTSKHKHTSFTQTQEMSCSRLSARVEYFKGSASTSTEHQVLPVCDPQSFNDSDFNIMDGAHENYLEDTNIEHTRKQKHTAGDYPLASWLPKRDAFILEMLRLEGHGDFISQATCRGTYGCSLPAEFRCEDCFGTELYCQSCTVERHHEHPLHRIKHWKDAFFHNVTLKSLGLQIQLGHPTQECCYNPAACQDFVVLHANGIHEVSTFEYWQTLTHLTHNRSVVIVKDCYDALLRMIQEWRNITLLKCFGRGHDPAACPQPGKNLPENWESDPSETRWLYALFLTIDANFCLARKNVSSDQMDPGLNCGWAYFMEEQQYKTFLTDVRRCPQEPLEQEPLTAHDTISNGPVVLVTCKKVKMNMDYLFFLTMQHMGDITVLNISYDIACQWSTNLWQRMHRYPSMIHLRHHNNKTITFLVLKFHLPVHIEICQITYSHNLLKGMGRTDGEAPECGWANINPVATSTCEMGPGSCRDTLDDHFGDFNWKKVTNMGVSLSRKLKAAVPECDQHVCDFEDFNNALEHERPKQVAEWRLAVERWESDLSQENPFALTGKHMLLALTQAAVRLSLSQQEADNLEHGMDDSLHEEVSRSVLISSGMEIEDQQTHLTEEKAHKIELWLPSKIYADATDPVHQCDATLSQYEWELRRAQAYDALDDLRRHLRLHAHLYKFKDTHICGQQANTRVSAIIDKVKSNVSIAAARYCRAWSALKRLSPALSHTMWREEFPKLENDDIHGMSQGKPGQLSGNPSDAPEGETVLNESLRIEWCKSRTRATHWVEEVQLLQEEMRRVAAYLLWHATWWDVQADRCTGLALAEVEGIRGYAKHQAAVWQDLHDTFLSKWGAVNGTF